MAPMTDDWRGPSKLPLAWLTLAVATAVRKSSRVRPYAASAAGLACTRTAGRCPPLMLTSPTPGSWAIFWASRVSARSSTWGSGKVAEVSPRVRMGVSAGFTLLYTGGFGRSGGRSVSAELIAACTSCSATSRPRLRVNCSVMTELPLELVDVIWFKPGICPRNRSSGAVTDDAITSGLAPG